MAKTFYYDSVGLLDLSSGSITAGTVSSTTFTVAAGEVTNEHYLKDMSIGHGVTSFDNNDCIRIDFGSTISADSVLHYMTTANTLDMIIYKSSNATTSLSALVTDAAHSVGWNINSVGIDTRYVFIESAESAFAGMTELVIGNKLQFENEPDIGISTQEVFATDINKSLGGVEYANKRHDPQSTWTLNFSNISSTFKGNLVNFEQDVTNYKKFVYYDDSAYHYVRLDAPIKFTEVAYQRFSASLKLREQLS